MIEKQQKQYLLFDLDGTIINSTEGVKKSFQYSIQKMGFTQKEDLQAVLFYKEYYSKREMYECKIYNGIEDVLCYLKSIDKK